MTKARLLADLLETGGDVISSALDNASSTGIDDNANATAITIDSSERVGLNTTTPGAKLEINSTGSYYNTANQHQQWSYSGTPFLSLYMDAYASPYFDTDSASSWNPGATIVFKRQGSEKFRITSAGFVGIGTSAPDTLLSLEQNNAPILQYKDTSGGTDAKVWRTMGLDSDYRLQTRSDDLATGELAYMATRTGKAVQTHKFFTTDNERVRIDASGNLFVATTTEASDDVGHALLANGAAYHTADGTYAGLFNRKSSDGDLVQFRKDNTVKHIITTTAFGIGNSSPESFHSSGNDLVVGSTTGGHGLTIVASTNDAGSINFADGSSGNTSYRGKITYEHSNDSLAFHTGATEKFRVGSNGNFSIGTTADDEKLVVNGNVKATAFQGDGSALTGISSGAGSVVAYIMFSGSNNSVQSTANVSSVNDNGTGEYIINFTTDLANANYSMAGAGRDPNTNGSIIGDVSYGRSDSIKEDGRCEIATYGDSANLSDFPEVNATFFQ